MVAVWRNQIEIRLLRHTVELLACSRPTLAPYMAWERLEQALDASNSTVWRNINLIWLSHTVAALIALLQEYKKEPQS